MMRVVLVHFVIAITIALPGTTVSAQREARVESDSIPRALGEALLRPSFIMLSAVSGQTAAPRLVVGVVPTGLAERLWIPPGATILGGVQSSGMGVAVLQSTLPPDSLEAGYRREQLRLGWTVAPRRNEPARTMGFVPAPTTEDDQDRPLGFCRGGDYLVIAIEDAPGHRRIFAQASGIGREVCNPSPPERSFPSWWNGRPTLINPPGVSAEPGQSCLRRNSSGGGGATLLITAAPIAEVMAHYGAQLADSGWVAVAGDETVQRSWTRRDSTGTVEEVTLTVRRRGVSPRCVEVSMGFSGMRR